MYRRYKHMNLFPFFWNRVYVYKSIIFRSFFGNTIHLQDYLVLIAGEGWGGGGGSRFTFVGDDDMHGGHDLFEGMWGMHGIGSRERQDPTIVLVLDHVLLNHDPKGQAREKMCWIF